MKCTARLRAEVEMAQTAIRYSVANQQQSRRDVMERRMEIVLIVLGVGIVAEDGLAVEEME